MHRATIVMNVRLGDDLNFRFFEALSCGALLLTRRQKDGHEILFKEGVHFAAFTRTTELTKQVDRYLTDEGSGRGLPGKGTRKHGPNTICGVRLNRS
jgi:spore maturation protein CgeB